MSSEGPTSSGDSRFASTDWGLIEAARGGNSPSARLALAELCSVYWYPLYAYIRRGGQPADRAQDLTQGLFASLLENDFLDVIDRRKGRFRSFLLAACQNYMANQRDRDRSRKRGGGCITLSIDLPDAEGRYAREPSHEITPELLFQRRWALTLLDHVLERLGEEMMHASKSAIFDRLKAALLGDGTAAPYAEVAIELGMTEDAVKMAALRLRRRYALLIREEVGRTVDDPAEVEDEIRDLFTALSP